MYIEKRVFLTHVGACGPLTTAHVRGAISPLALARAQWCWLLSVDYRDHGETTALAQNRLGPFGRVPILGLCMAYPHRFDA